MAVISPSDEFKEHRFLSKPYQCIVYNHISIQSSPKAHLTVIDIPEKAGAEALQCGCPQCSMQFLAGVGVCWHSLYIPNVVACDYGQTWEQKPRKKRTD